MTGAIERVLTALNAAEVEYLVVGGVAVVLHGHLRTTADLDLIISLLADNVDRAVVALKDLGYRPRAPVPIEHFADVKKRASWVRDKGMTVFSLWSPVDPTLEVDIFVEEPLDFGQAFERAPLVKLDSTTAKVISLEDLIELKRVAGRPQDQLDIDALSAISVHEGNADK